MSKKKYFIDFLRYLHEIFTRVEKKNISSHSVTSKQPHKIVQILMRHPVVNNYLPIEVSSLARTAPTAVAAEKKNIFNQSILKQIKY